VRVEQMPRLMPDLVGCDIHGNEDMSLPRVLPNGYSRRPYCLVCVRERTSKGHYNGPRCINGHLKTPLTWVLYGKGTYRRCRTCNNEYSRRRYEQRRKERHDRQRATAA